LIETSQKLLWYRSDAEQIFKQAEGILQFISSLPLLFLIEILSKASIPESTGPTNIEVHQYQISNLVELGFTEKQAQIALKRTKFDLHAAMELLLVQPDIDDNEKETKMLTKTTSLYSRNGPFIPFRQFLQQYFQPNPTVKI
jgi:hypothetical protein